eukprot:1161945-Pelagomonas_calceolata.AAC.5
MAWTPHKAQASLGAWSRMSMDTGMMVRQLLRQGTRCSSGAQAVAKNESMRRSSTSTHKEHWARKSPMQSPMCGAAREQQVLHRGPLASGVMGVQSPEFTSLGGI